MNTNAVWIGMMYYDRGFVLVLLWGKSCDVEERMQEF